LLGIVYATAAVRSLGFSELSNGRGATNVEAVTYTPEMGSTKSGRWRPFRRQFIRCFVPIAQGAIALKTAPLVALRLRFTQTPTST